MIDKKTGVRMEIKRDRLNPDNDKLTMYWPNGGYVRWHANSVGRWIERARKEAKKTGNDMRKTLFDMLVPFG